MIFYNLRARWCCILWIRPFQSPRENLNENWEMYEPAAYDIHYNEEVHNLIFTFLITLYFYLYFYDTSMMVAEA